MRKFATNELHNFAFLLLTLIALCYGHTLNYPFHFDDMFIIVNNESIRDINDLAAIWNRNPSRFIAFYSLALNYHISELHTFGYHIFNTAVHIVTSLLAFIFTSTIISAHSKNLSADQAQVLLSWRVAISFFVGLVFAIHPLQTESVTYIWQRNTSLTSMFYLLSLTLFLKSGLNEPKEEHGVPFSYWASILFAIAASFTKQIAVTLPVVIIVTQYYFITPTLVGMRRSIGRLAPFFLILMIIPIMTALGLSSELNDVAVRQQNVLTPYIYFLTQLKVVILYFKLLIVPLGQNLDYEFAASLGLIESIWPLFIHLGLFFGALFIWRKHRLISFGIVFFYLSISVESTFFPLEDIVFEHRVYLPMLGFWLCLAMAFIKFLDALIPKSAKQYFTLFTILIVSAFSFLTYERNLVWKDHVTMWSDIVEKSPDKMRAYTNLVAAYKNMGRLKEGRKHILRLANDNKKNPNALLAAGYISEALGDETSAVEYMTKSVAIKPKQDVANYVLGNFYLTKKKYQRAAKHYFNGIQTDSEFSEQAHHSLGTALALSGKYKDSIKVYLILAHRYPDNTSYSLNLSKLYGKTGDMEKSEMFMNKAVRREFSGQ